MGGFLQGGEFVHLGLQGVQVGDDAALFVEGGLEHEQRERARNTRKPFAPFVSFRVFRDPNAPRSQLSPKRPIQHRRQQRVQLRLGGILQGGEFVYLGLQGVQVGNDITLLVKRRNR